MGHEALPAKVITSSGAGLSSTDIITRFYWVLLVFNESLIVIKDLGVDSCNIPAHVGMLVVLCT
jgi:hypothetical protein